MSYSQRLQTITAHTKQTEASVADTKTSAEATYAVAELDEKHTIKVSNVLIPFHAVDYAEITTSFEEVDKADPYGCDSGSDADAITTNNGEIITDENDNPIIGG